MNHKLALNQWYKINWRYKNLRGFKNGWIAGFIAGYLLSKNGESNE